MQHCTYGKACNNVLNVRKSVSQKKSRVRKLFVEAACKFNTEILSDIHFLSASVLRFIVFRTLPTFGPLTN
jgi:hypothetical protein